MTPMCFTLDENCLPAWPIRGERAHWVQLLALSPRRDLSEQRGEAEEGFCPCFSPVNQPSTRAHTTDIWKRFALVRLRTFTSTDALIPTTKLSDVPCPAHPSRGAPGVKCAPAFVLTQIVLLPPVQISILLGNLLAHASSWCGRVYRGSFLLGCVGQSLLDTKREDRRQN